MSTEIVLPKLGFSMTEAILSEWLFNEGDQVEEGTPLFALESDKSTQEVESPGTGKLRIVMEVGETYDVGTVLGYLD